ncbi:MAG: phenylalanine--tRNA ligase subunit beta [Candidatus Jorgensenbacteria bacterium]
MKFSYSLIKTFVPKLPSKTRCVDALTMHAFEAEDGSMDAFEVALPPNRYSDAASHVGIARELAAIFNLPLKAPTGMPLPKERNGGAHFAVRVEDRERCPRYTASYFDGIKVKPSPAWMQQTLISCGLRPISNVVDIMNYVMLEVGQPLHAFDYDKLANGHEYPTNNTNGAKKIREIRGRISEYSREIVVRRAKQGERITSIDGVAYVLTSDELVIADERGSLALAGVKGGKGSEVDGKTARLIVEAANFENTGIYRTSKRLNLATDASTRFSHAIAPALAEAGMARATELLIALVGARPGECFDSQRKAPPRRLLKFDVAQFSRLIGTSITRERAAELLRRLGFQETKKDVWEVPPFRMDIATHEDLAEEVVRLMGLNELRAAAPRVVLSVAEEDEMIREKERVRRVLSGLGVDEVYLHSMISREEAGGAVDSAVPIENPPSSEFAYLRPSLLPGLRRSAGENLKYFSHLRLFEIGKVFGRDRKGKIVEETKLGIVVAGQERDVFFALKGIITGVCKGMGLTDFRMVPPKKLPPAPWYGFTVLQALSLESEGKEIGFLGPDPKPFKGGQVAIAEIDFDALVELAEGEAEFRPLSRYPSVMRDVSVVVGVDAKVGDMMQEMQLANQKLICDVDLIDEYTQPSWKENQGLTFRIVFQADDRTLSAAEVDAEMKKIAALLTRMFRAEVR